MCSQPSPYAPLTSLVVSNNCGISLALRSLYARFLALYRVRAHLHHYLEYIDGDTFQEAAVAVDGVVQEYEAFRV
jgi:tubulin epsilon